MNIRIPNTFDSIPTAVQGIPAAIRRTGSRTRLILAALAVLVAVAAIWLYLLGGKTETPPPPPVNVAVARVSNVTVVEHTLGTVIANSTVQVTARVSGQLMSASFKEGDTVHAGDMLFLIDPRPFQAALEQARAALAKDQAALVSADNDERRFSALFAQGAASSQQRDQAVATAKGLAATVQSDHAAVDVALLNLNYTRIRSPIDGKTGPILIQPGNLITATGGSGSTGTATNTTTGSVSTSSGTGGSNPLVVITQFQPVKVSFSLPQADLPRIQQRQREGTLSVAIDAHDGSGKPLEAPIDFVSNAVSNTTGTIELRANYANSDSRLVPGQLIDVGVALATLPNAIVVPREAVNIGPESRFVLAVDHDDIAQLRNVTVLFDDGATMAIAGPVRAGDRVITDGQLRVLPGKPVTVTRPAGKAPRTP